MTCSCCQAKAFHGLSGLSQPHCSCSCPPTCGCGCQGFKSKKSKCRCNGNCMCGKVKTKAPSDCPCGCGGACGCGPESSMGSFEEYPRPKSALFDPRQLDQVWPEPHPDPLIPYVRANEGLLPYDSLNRYKGAPNSLHGYLAMGADQSPKRTAYSGAKALIDALSQANKGYSYVYMQSPEVPKKDMVYVPSPIAAEDNFFAFIPVQRLTKDRKSVFEIYIRCEGPESKTVEYDDSDTFSPKSGERKYLQQVLADMELNPKDWGSYLQNAMGSRYPLVLSSASKDFLVTKHVSGTAPGATNAYSSSKKSFQILGEHLLDFLISRSSGNYVEMGNDTQGKESMRLFLKDLLAVCLTPKTAQEIKDVASGIAKAFVERLKSDLGYAAKMGTQKWQYRNIIGQLQSMPVDPRFKDVYAKINLTQPAYDNLEDRLVEGLAAAITTRKNTLSSLYRGLFQSSSSQEQTSDAEIQRLEGEKQALQAEIEALKAGAPSSDLPSADKTKLEGELSSLSDEKEKAEGNAKFWKIGAIVLTGVGLASGYLIHKAQTKNSIMR